MKNMARIIGGLVVLLFVAILLTACWRRVIPNSGIYYCEEIGTRIDFDSGYFLEVDGEEAIGQIDNDRGSYCFTLWCEDESSDRFGQMYYAFKCIRYDDKEMIVSDYESGELYTFVCLEQTDD